MDDNAKDTCSFIHLHAHTHRYTPMTRHRGPSTYEGAPSWTQVQIKMWVGVFCASRKVLMGERFVWVWWSQTGNTMHLFKSQQSKMLSYRKMSLLTLGGLSSPAPQSHVPSASRHGRSTWLLYVLSTHSSQLGKFQRPGLKTLWAFLMMDYGFGLILENLDFLQSNISWAWMLEKARAPWPDSYPMGTWMVLGPMGLRVWWCADNSWPGLMGFFMQVWDRMLGE